jgi:hypothetical protein
MHIATLPCQEVYVTGEQSQALRSATLRLLVIPFALWSAWMLELFLLAGSLHIFLRFDPPGVFIYTLVACILTGLVAPLVCIRTAFVSGAINMFQIGFRSLRRTLLSVFLTCCGIYGAVIVSNPFGTDRLAFAHACGLLLPTAIASVMMCWVLIGTHLQAFVRSGGAIMSVSLGIAVTSIIYSITTFAYFAPVLEQDVFFPSLSIGIIAAFFFFAVRDVYATSLVVCAGSVFCAADRINPLYLQSAGVYVWISSGLTVCTLIGVHWYLSRNFVTIKIPEN